MNRPLVRLELDDMSSDTKPDDKEGKEGSKDKENKEEAEYVASLSDIELRAYHIAKTHLGASFCLRRSGGFITWKQQQKQSSGTS